MVVVFIQFMSVFLTRVSLISPFSINAICWFLALTSGALLGHDYYDLTYETTSILLAWITITGTITFIFSWRYKVNKEKVFYIINIRNTTALFISFICLFLLVELFREIYVVGYSGDYGFFLNLRMAAIADDKIDYALTFSTRIYPIMLALFCLFIASQRNNSYNKSIILFLLVWHVSYAVATMSKFWFLSLFIIIILALVSKERMRLKRLLLIAIFVFVSFYVLNLLRSETSEGLQTNILYQLLLYSYSPIVALNYVNTTVVDSSMLGEYTFSFIYNVAKSLGIMDGQKISGILPYVNVPVETNIYTALQPFVADFGFIGACLGALFYGFLYSLIFRLGNVCKWAFPCYLTVVYSLALQFITETLIMNFSGNIKAVISVILIFFILKKTGVIKSCD